MGQVPASSTFLVIGDGRLARHLHRYLLFEKISSQNWNRRQNTIEDLRASTASHVLLAISDSALEGFVREHAFLRDRTIVHFSGALSLKEIPSAHPLMTFSDEPYVLETYRTIPFVLERGRGELARLLPGLKNPTFEIESSQKVLYHSLCVLSGNFTVLLWEKAFAEFSSKLGIPKDALLPYLRQTTENLANAPVGKSVLTGPLARGDRETIARHLAVLKNDPFGPVYQAFVDSQGPRPQAGETKV
jgi:predicted short-subunit dehydrogenase-like oxidoreductase (DUF2520 family)